MTNEPAVPWSIRAAALLEAAGELGARAAGAPEGRRRTALLGLRCLGAFAAKQFAFFDQGFARGTLAPDAAFPPEFILEATARQVSFDIDVLLRSIGQRDDENSTAPMRAALALGDSLAADALALAIRHRLIEETAVLTYFQKTPTIRLLPYVPLALIGIDLTAVKDEARLLAVAHEVGHHVYRQMATGSELSNGSNIDRAVGQRAAAPAAAPANAAAQYPAWLLAWAEEIFADVYSVLVAGPVAAHSIQSMLAAELPGVLLQDDADHPLPALRPQIALAVLRALAGATPAGAPGGASLAATADLLQRQWDAFLADRMVGDSFTAKGSGERVALDTARHLLQTYVGSLLDEPLAGAAREAKAQRWSSAGASVADLYAAFAQTCKRLQGAPLPELAAVGEQIVQVTPQVAGLKGGRRTVGEIGDRTLDDLRDDALRGKRTLTDAEWKAVFLAGDWVTEEGGSGIIPVR
jgi:hypothetical protein